MGRRPVSSYEAYSSISGPRRSILYVINFVVLFCEYHIYASQDIISLWHSLVAFICDLCLKVLINGQYCFPPSEVYNEVLDSEMELDAIVDELSKQCADLVLEEPVSYFTIEANNQILEDEEEDTYIEEENTLRKDSTKGSAVEDGCSGLSEREKKIVIYIKKYIVENATKLSDQVASEFSLPQEWPYEY
ncbi:hypothetical protein Tco_0981235 [Tanacetum coccineum]